MKKIFLKEEHIKYIKEEIKKGQINVPSSILNALQRKETYIPLNDIDFSKKLLDKSFNNTLSFFSDDIMSVPLNKTLNHLSKLIVMCNKKEKNIKPQLEKLCYDTIIRIFNIPEDEIAFSCELVDFIDDGKEFHISPDTDEDFEYENLEAIDVEKTEVEKRRLINMLTIGASQKIFDESKRLYLNEVSDLDEELPYLYSKLMKLNQHLLYRCDVKIKDKNHHQGGYVKVTLGNDDELSKIEVKAVNFPILLFESIKGIMELVSSNGLPDDMSIAKNVINKSDILEEEPWDMRFGGELWNIVTLNKNIDTKIIPDFFSKLIEIDAIDFISLINELSHNTKQGKQSVEELIKDCEYTSEYNDFETDIIKKKTDLDVIEDGYFNEEELSHFG